MPELQVLRSAGDGDVHREDTSTATDIENDLVLKEVLVLDDGVHVRLGANLVLQHLLVDAFGAQQSRLARGILWIAVKANCEARSPRTS